MHIFDRISRQLTSSEKVDGGGDGILIQGAGGPVFVASESLDLPFLVLPCLQTSFRSKGEPRKDDDDDFICRLHTVRGFIEEREKAIYSSIPS